jgi:tetratricopeptide (TPR) repeat protein
MKRKNVKPIAVKILRVVLGTVLLATLSLLLNSLAGDHGFSEWLGNETRHSSWNLFWAAIAAMVLLIANEIWQHDSSEEAAAPAAKPTTEEMLFERYEAALREGAIAKLDAQQLKEELARQEAELQRLQEQLAARSSEPAEAALAKLLQAGDLDGALRLKSRQVEARRADSAQLPRNLYELGTIHELRFEWPQALAAYREASERGKEPEYGFKYAHFAQKLNRFSDAIVGFEALLGVHMDPVNRASALNNLANLYCDTQRMREAEKAYDEALSIRRELAASNPGAYLPQVAMTLNNLAVMFTLTQRLPEAEQAYVEALSTYRVLAKANPGAHLSDVAMALNNLANLCNDTRRVKQAEDIYGEALSIYRDLAKANPDAHISDIAMSLNNLGLVYGNTQRTTEAELAHTEALAIRRKLAAANPDAYLPDVATTLNNLGLVYGNTQRTTEAGLAHAEALAIRRKLAAANPDAYLPDVATTLNNLASLHFSMGRINEAETEISEAVRILSPLWQANPGLHGNRLARTLFTHALISEATKAPLAEACEFAARALSAAYDPALKQAIQRLIDRLCPESATAEG